MIHHGFDILFGHAWHDNIKWRDNTVGKGLYNMGVTVKGHWAWWPIYYAVEDIFRLTMHEVLHQYYCQHTEDLGVPGSGYVMNRYHWSGGRKIYDENRDTLNSTSYIYDGI